MILHIRYVKIEARKGGIKRMARLNLIISDSLNKEMREYLKTNNLTITTFLHLAITKYLESQAKKEVKKKEDPKK